MDCHERIPIAQSYQQEAAHRLRSFLLAGKEHGIYTNSTPIELSSEQLKAFLRSPSPACIQGQTCKTFRHQIAEIGFQKTEKTFHSFNLSSKEIARIDPWASLRQKPHPFLTASEGSFKPIYPYHIEQIAKEKFSSSQGLC